MEVPRMKKWIFAAAAVLALAMASGSFYARSEKGPDVKIIRVPNGGIQPQVAVDKKGVVHMTYFKGEPAHGDVFYVTSKDWGTTFSSPIQVNSEPGTAIASGTIRGPRLAIGKNGRVHVAWNGTSKSSLRGPLNPAQPGNSPYNGLPMLYTRLNNAGTAFEPDKNLMKLTFGLDGGGAVAADPSGHVYVAWHGKRVGDADGEAGRSVWIASSRDEGRSFTPEAQAYKEPTGACGCCSLSILSESNGTVYILYRSATEMVHRDIHLLVSKDYGKTFTGQIVDKWNIGACPMSSMTFAETPNELLASWQTEEQVYYATIDPTTMHLSSPIPAPGTGKVRKYPALAVNGQGDTIFVWSEGTGWGKGGSLDWQVFDKEGKPTGEKESVADLPAWSFGAAFARPDGGFSVIY
jgi:hypothetical protein